MASVWRIHCNSKAVDDTSEAILEFWQKAGIIGVGWSHFFKDAFLEDAEDASEVRNRIKNKLIEEKLEKNKIDSFTTQTNAIVDRMEIGDYVWVKADGSETYYIAKVLSGCRFMRNNDDFHTYDIGFYRNVEFSKGFSKAQILDIPSNRSTLTRINGKYLLEYTEALFYNQEFIKINIKNWEETIKTEAEEA